NGIQRRLLQTLKVEVRTHQKSVYRTDAIPEEPFQKLLPRWCLCHEVSNLGRINVNALIAVNTIDPLCVWLCRCALTAQETDGLHSVSSPCVSEAFTRLRSFALVCHIGLFASCALCSAHSHGSLARRRFLLLVRGGRCRSPGVGC